MNKLIFQDFFQIILNDFIVNDRELIPWKLTCLYCYYYIHNINILCIDIKKCKNILNYTKIIEIDTNFYINKTNIYFYKDCECGLSDHILTSFDINFLSQDLQHLKVLKLTHMNYPNDNKLGHLISKLTSLEYLDLGINTYINDYSFKNLKNLKLLYLRNNTNTSSIFRYLPNLKIIQICFDIDSNMYYIDPSEIPSSISKIIQNGYSYDCPINGWKIRDGCEPLYQHEEYSIVIKSEKN
jgi:hypothetical protein